MTILAADGKTGRIGYGNWVKLGIPHKEWTCVGIKDHGVPTTVCEMCSAPLVRYVHYMQHPDYPEVLRVGEDCARHMQQPLVNPKKREASLQTLARLEKTLWTQKWHVSQSGNLYARTVGYVLMIFGQEECWSVRVVNDTTKKRALSTKDYKTQEEAVLGAFDVLEWAKEHLI